MKKHSIFRDFAIGPEDEDLFQILRRRLTSCFESSDCSVQKMYIIKACNLTSALAQWGRRTALATLAGGAGTE